MTLDVVPAVVGICAAGAVWAAVARPRPADRLRTLVRERSPVRERSLTRPAVESALRTVLTSVGARVRGVASRPPDPDADHRAGAAVTLGLLGAVLHPVVGVALAAASVGLDVLRRRRAGRPPAADQLIVEVPDVVDLFHVAAGGGLTVMQAVEAVAAVSGGQLALVLRDVHRRVLLGERLVDSLEVLGQVGVPVRPLAGALLSAERDGAALAGPLERASDHARDLRRRRAEEAARRVPVQLLFPLVACVLPAFTLLTVVPLLAGTLQTLSL